MMRKIYVHGGFTRALNTIIVFLLLAAGMGQNSLFGDPGKFQTNNKTKSFSKTVIIKGNPVNVFAFMDDIANTGMHMTKSNTPMLGSKLTVEWLTDYKTGLGSTYRWRGNVIGMNMDFTVEVTKWVQGKEKTWESTGDAAMIVLSWYRMYLILTPLVDETTKAELGIYYKRPEGNLLGLLLAKRYAKWCVKSMLRDTRKHFNKI